MPPWVLESLDALATLEAGWASAAAGESLLHCDARADNLLVASGHGKLVDWPSACRGNPLVELVFAAPAIAMQGGPTPPELLAGRTVDGDALRPLVAAFAGYLVANGHRPAPPGLPTLRAFQLAQAEVALGWLRSLLR